METWLSTTQLLGHAGEHSPTSQTNFVSSAVVLQSPKFSGFLNISTALLLAEWMAGLSLKKACNQRSSEKLRRTPSST
jgi:hypothetical protein